MDIVLEIKEQIKALYAKFDIYIVSVLKFLLTFLTLKMINSDLGFMARLNDSAVVLLASLVCAVFPWGMTAMVSVLFVAAHFYAVSLEAAGIFVILLLLMFCAYIRFGKGDSGFITLTILLFSLGTPYMLPIIAGLTMGISTAMPIAFGIIIYYMIQFVSGNTAAISGKDTDEIVTRVRAVVDGLIDNKQMLLFIIAFTLTIVLVYVIRKLSVDFAWIVAVGAGAIVDVMILLIGKLLLDIPMTAGNVILGTVVAILVGLVCNYFLFMVDYRRTERVQLEDDEYVYYVKAVPKINAGKLRKKVRRVKKTVKRPVQKKTEQN